MACTVTCYFNDVNIKYTQIALESGTHIYTGYYGDSDYVAAVNGNPKFTAAAQDGCQFTRWVYRLGSTTADVRYSYNNPFLYNGTLKIFIRAEGEPIIVTPTRPDYFYWTYPKTSGQPFKLTATEWNGLTSNINAVREYCGYLQYGFTTAYRGNQLTAAMYNQAVNAIKGISGYGYYLSTVNKGDPVTAYHLNILVSELNAVK